MSTNLSSEDKLAELANLYGVSIATIERTFHRGDAMAQARRFLLERYSTPNGARTLHSFNGNWLGVEDRKSLLSNGRLFRQAYIFLDQCSAWSGKTKRRGLEPFTPSSRHVHELLKALAVLTYNSGLSHLNGANLSLRAWPWLD